MITPEPPAGSEHYREGWRHGYEQAAIDRERSTDAARLVPEVVACPARDSAGAPCRRTDPHGPDSHQAHPTVAAAQAPESPTNSTPKAGRWGSSEAETATDSTPDRLAWISEAGETAAAERQARYQETACARRPAEERPDA